MDLSQIMIIGGTGRLGSRLMTRFPAATAPSRSELDLANPAAIGRALERHRPRLVVNAAGYTDVAAAETQRAACWESNVVGVSNLVQQLFGTSIGLLHVSTDYVFDGQRGSYRESDTPGPTCNYYALTKLVGEQIAAALPDSLIVRTSFREGTWPHPVAFQDLYTSQDYLDVIAPDIALLIEHWGEFPDRVLQVATERKSAYELALRRRPDVKAGWRKDAKVSLPADISLDVSRWLALKKQFSSSDKEVDLESRLQRIHSV